MDWPLVIGSLATSFIVLVGIVSGIIQIVQYIEEHRNRPRIDRKRQKKQHQPPNFLKQPENLSSWVLIPNNLPSRGTFIGRDDKKKELYEAIALSPILTIVEGVAGIGKTSLALEVAYKYLGEAVANQRKSSPTGESFRAIIWLSAKASAITIDNIIDSIARILDYPYISQLEQREKFNEIIELLRKIKSLIVIDNFETIKDQDVIRFIENVASPSKLVITTRRQHGWNVPFIPIELDKLRLEEGIELIISEIKRLGLSLTLQSNSSPLIELYEVTGSSPLAIKWAIGQMKQRGQSLTTISTTLRTARADIFQTMFFDSWSNLAETSKQILLVMPIFATTASREALSVISNIYGFKFDEALGELVELWLIESNRELIEEKQRFSIHPLTRSFLLKELSNLPDLEVQMRVRTVDYYLRFCNERRYLQRGLNGYDEIENEMPNILKILAWLYEQCISRQNESELCLYIIKFSDAVNVFFWSRGFWGERVFLCERALQASERLSDWASAGRQAYLIGIVRFWQGDVLDAEKWANISRTYLERIGNHFDMALTERLLGLIAMGKGEYEQALEIHKAVLEKISQPGIIKPEEIRIFADWICPHSSEGYKAGIVSLLQELGIISNRQGAYISARKWLQDSVALARQIDDKEGLSISFSHLGNALFGLGNLDEARSAYIMGLELATQVQRKSTIGRCNQGLANLSAAENNVPDMLTYGKEAMNFFERLGMQREKQQMLDLLGRISY